MEVFHVVERWWILLLAITIVVGANTPGFRGHSRKTVFNKMGVTFATSDAGSIQTDEFPNELHYTMSMEGANWVELHLVRDKFMHTPDMLSQNSGHSINKGTGNLRTAFYTDTQGYGSFACVASTDVYGDFSCKLSALLDMGQEACFIPPGSTEADCMVKHEGTIDYFEEINDEGMSSRKHAGSATVGTTTNRRRRSMTSTNKTFANRPKRSLFPEAGFQVIEVAYIVDKAFMSVFYDRHPDDTTAAEIEADLYVTLLTNEMNIYYSSIKEVSNGALDIYLYPAALVFPPAGSDFTWIEDNRSGSYFIASDAVDNEIAGVINGGYTDKQWDHTMVLTGLDIYYGSSSTLGYAYIYTICNPKSKKKFSVNEARYYNICRIGAHEIGHALGMGHDDNDQCEAGVNIMSGYIFDVTSGTKDTFYKFSACSVADAVNWLSYAPSCTTENGFTDVQFREKFCSGLPGTQQGYLTLQCQHRTGWSGSTPCNTPTEARDCYEANRIRCRTSSNSCVSLKFVWQGTSCGTDKVCYNGDCVSSFNVCDVTTTSTTTTTTTTTTPTTTSTSTTTTPTTTSTSTTTTPTTTSTSTTTTPTTTSTSTTTTPTTTSTSKTTTPTTTSTTTTTTPTTTSTSTTTTPTTTSTTATTTPTTTTQTVNWAPCTCCGIKRNKRRTRCCKTGRKLHNGKSCYCCKELRYVKPPNWYNGPQY